MYIATNKVPMLKAIADAQLRFALKCKSEPQEIHLTEDTIRVMADEHGDILLRFNPKHQDDAAKYRGLAGQSKIEFCREWFLTQIREGQLMLFGRKVLIGDADRLVCGQAMEVLILERT